MDKFTQLKELIGEIIKRSETKIDYQHSLSTRNWVLKLDPNASEELQIAALAHDIDRAIPPRVYQQKGERYKDYKQKHAKRSAELIAKLMKESGYASESIVKVVHFVENHEVGGDEEINMLTDADSISYFTNNIESYLASKGNDLTRDKIKFMYVRSSERAKKIIAKLQFDSSYNKLIHDTITAIK